MVRLDGPVLPINLRPFTAIQVGMIVNYVFYSLKTCSNMKTAVFSVTIAATQLDHVTLCIDGDH